MEFTGLFEEAARQDLINSVCLAVTDPQSELRSSLHLHHTLISCSLGVKCSMNPVLWWSGTKEIDAEACLRGLSTSWQN